MSAIKIATFTDVYNAEPKFGEGVNIRGQPVAYWSVAGPAKTMLTTWDDKYSGLDKQRHVVSYDGKNYDVQSSRIQTAPGNWGVVAANISHGNTDVKGLLHNMGEVSTLKELFGKLWEQEGYANPYPGAKKEYNDKTVGTEKDPRANYHRANFSYANRFGFFTTR